LLSPYHFRSKSVLQSFSSALSCLLVGAIASQAAADRLR
jgi:hypothetical protein